MRREKTIDIWIIWLNFVLNKTVCYATRNVIRTGTACFIWGIDESDIEIEHWDRNSFVWCSIRRLLDSKRDVVPHSTNFQSSLKHLIHLSFAFPFCAFHIDCMANAEYKRSIHIFRCECCMCIYMQCLHVWRSTTIYRDHKDFVL